jgi:hypothetical protein
MSETINLQSSKPKGGKRAGAGRKPSTIKGIVKKLPKDTAVLILSEINANSKWKTLSESKDERVQLEVLKYLTDRAHGKAKQKIEHMGEDGGPIQTSIAVRFV